MNPRPALRLAALLPTALLVLAGCVSFERAPVSELRCDTALAGHWRAVAMGPSDRTIRVAADCTMQWPEDNGDTYVTRLEGFALGDQRYLVFTPEVADRLMSAEGDIRRRATAGSVLLARYRIDGDEARVWLADLEAVRRFSTEGGTRLRKVDDSFVHVEGGRRAIDTLLRAHGERIFAGSTDGKGALQLRRVPAAEAAP
jgi:hypothetical protein